MGFGVFAFVDCRSWLRVETMEKLLRRLIELDSDLEGS